MLNAANLAVGVTYLAHGGEMTSDELAGVGFGIAFAMLFPVAALFVVMRRIRKTSAAAENQANQADTPSVPAEPDRDDGHRLEQSAGPEPASRVGTSGPGSKEIL
ncbi:MAG: hypothetical protein QJR12_02320 [Mycobacterium sp.]|uniref:hypothetical protein n=1 Tax=Mycobacterium sp. TaxID=1785 RepID=UPI00262C4FEF|nr:hypothetical protein [Mycobacterium sp.]MDI3313147.1 hypothetical protein [Mycobacterium sp.]